SGNCPRVHVPQYDVSVGNRRMDSASFVTNWSRDGACTGWSNSQGSTLLDPCDTAATSAGLDDVERRNRKRVAAAPAVTRANVNVSTNLHLVLLDRGAIFNEASLDCGTTHVEGNSAIDA